MASQLDPSPPPSLLWRWWQTASGAVYAAVVSIGLVTALAVWARLPFASYLEMVSLGGLAVAVLLSIIGKILERLKLIPKTKSPITPTGELEGSPTLSEPIPIVEASASDSRAEDIGEADERRRSAATLSDQLDSGTIPRVLTRSGVDAVWRLEPSREGSSEKDAG